MTPKTIAGIQLGLLALAVALFFWWTGPKPTDEFKELAVATTTAATGFPATDITAQSAYVYDVSTGNTVYAKDPDAKRPLASLTKLMSALVASTIVPSYVQVTINPSDIQENGDNGLYVDESWNIGKLMDFSLITSSNDGIHAIAAVAGSLLETASTTAASTSPLDLFVQRMNVTARQLGLRDTSFMNESGLDISTTTSGGYGSAKDVASLLKYIIEHDPHLLEATTVPKMAISSDVATHLAQNTDLSIPDIPNLIASKTGYTDLAGGNVVVAFNAGLDHPMIIAILGSTYEGRFSDLDALASSTLKYLDLKASQSGPKGQR